MICAVYIRWLDGHGNWSPVHTRCIDVKDGDIERAARVLAKSFGKLKGFFITENDKVEFKDIMDITQTMNSEDVMITSN